MFRRDRCWLMMVAACLLTTGLGARGDEAQKIPRYKLHPGQVLTYRQRSEFRHKSGTTTEAAEAHFQVVRANPDGSWYLIFDARGRSSSTDKPKPSALGFLKDLASQVTQTVAPGRHDEVSLKLAEFDLFPDGRVVSPDSVDLVRNDPTDYLAALPATAGEQVAGWTAPDSGPARTGTGSATRPPAATRTPGSSTPRSTASGTRCTRPASAKPSASRPGAG